MITVLIVLIIVFVLSMIGFIYCVNHNNEMDIVCIWGICSSIFPIAIVIVIGTVIGWTEESHKEHYMKERQVLIEEIKNTDNPYMLYQIAERVYDFNNWHGDDKDLYIDFNEYAKVEEELK